MSFPFRKQELHGVCFEKRFSGMLQRHKIQKELFFKGINSVWKLFHLQSKGKTQITYQPLNRMQFDAPVQS